MKTAVIHILDEVNCKITGLELSIRKFFNKKYSYLLPGAQFMPSVRLGRWDGKSVFFQLGGTTFINLLPEILPKLMDEGYEIDIQDHRDNRIVFDFQPVTSTSYSYMTWPKNHMLEGQPIVIHDHQAEVVNKFLENHQCIQVAATGSGKTLSTAILSHQAEKYGRTIVIVPSQNLVIQTQQDYHNMGLDVGVYYGKTKEYGKTHTICTWQSIERLYKNSTSNDINAEDLEITLDKFLEGVVCVIVDECHNSKAPILKSLLSGPFAKIPIRWGLTGTIPKEEMFQVSLTCTLGEVIHKVTASELQELGILSNCHVHCLQLIDVEAFPTYATEHKFLLENDSRLDFIAEKIYNASLTGNTLVLIDRVAPGNALAEKITKLMTKNNQNDDKSGEQHAAVFLSGTDSATIRKEHYDSITTSNNAVIVATYGIAAVGIDIPRIFNLVLIEPGRSFVRTIQSVGRGLRRARDKDFVNIWDISSTCKYSKKHLAARRKFYKEANYKNEVTKIHWKK